MRVITWPWRIVLLTLLALLAIPATRDTLRDQLGLLSPLPPYYLFQDPSTIEDNRVQKLWDNLIMRTQAKNPRDWQIALGAGLLISDPTKKNAWLKEASKLAPQEPAVFAAIINNQVRQLHYRRNEELGYGKPLPAGGREEELLTSQQTQSAAAALESWQRLEPDNSAPKALLAWVDFGEKQDAAGREQLQAAARAPRLDFYSTEIMKAQIKALRAGGLTDFDAATSGAASVFYPQLAGLRSIARVAVYKGYAAQAAGKNQEALDDWLAVIHFGRQMRYQEKTIIGYLVGTAIEAIGSSPVYKWNRRNVAAEMGLKPAYPQTGKTGRYNNGDYYQGKSYGYFLKYAGPAATSDILAGMEQAYTAKLTIQKDIRADNDNWRRSLDLLKPGLVMLLGIVAMLGLSALAGLLTWGKRDRLLSLRAPWAIIISLLALLPMGIYALVISLPATRDFYYYFTHLNPLGSHFAQWYIAKSLPRLNPFALHFTPAVLLLFWLLPAGLWIWLKGKKSASFWLTYTGLVRRTVPVGLLFVILGYGVLTVSTARLRAEFINTITQGEMTRFHRAHPELFQPPEAK